jgi:hypothetical protein
MSINPISPPAFFNTVNDLPLVAQNEINTQGNSMAIQQMNTAHEHRKEENEEIQEQANS